MEKESFSSIINVLKVSDQLPAQVEVCTGIENLISAIKGYDLCAGKYIFLDNSIQVDGDFFNFCKVNNYCVEKIYVDFISLLSDRDCKSLDQFVYFGGLTITQEDFSFNMFTALDNGNEGAQITVTVLDLSKYDRYLEFKTKYFELLDKKQGVTINVVGGEDYVLDKTHTWENLFIGDKAELKNEIISDMNGFMSNEKRYLDNNLSWKTLLLINGAVGNGKTETIKTLISNYNFKPITITPTNCDDSVIVSIFNAVARGRNYMLILENLDLLFSEAVLSPDKFIKACDRFQTKTGLVVVATTRNMTDAVKKINFDKIYTIKEPNYEICSNIFAPFFTKEELQVLATEFKTEKFSYEYIIKTKNLFVDKVIRDPNFGGMENIGKIIQSLSKENKFVNKKYLVSSTNKKLGIV